jgi:hypothetical protein
VIDQFLQGGVNNFGIVTHITLKTFPLDQVWVSNRDTLPLFIASQGLLQGGTLVVQGDLDQAITATAHYANVTTDPRAIMAALYTAVNGTVNKPLRFSLPHF